MKSKRIAMIGAGNVASHLAQALVKNGFNLCQIYNRSIEGARELGMKTGISYTTEAYAVYPDNDIYIFSVSDDSLPSVYKSIRMNENALVIHTSGSLPMSVFSVNHPHVGVLYPLQTFSKKRDLDFREIPVFVEGSSRKVLNDIKTLAQGISDCVEEADSSKRLFLHLSAVFACNFANHLYYLAGKILKDHQLDFSVLRPLIMETAQKVMLMTPEEAQTGPAVRGDDSIISKHKALLKDEKVLHSIYTVLSNSIKKSKAVPDQKADNADGQMSLW